MRIHIPLHIQYYYHYDCIHNTFLINIKFYLSLFLSLSFTFTFTFSLPPFYVFYLLLLWLLMYFNINMNIIININIKIMIMITSSQRETHETNKQPKHRHSHSMICDINRYENTKWESWLQLKVDCNWKLTATESWLLYWILEAHSLSWYKNHNWIQCVANNRNKWGKHNIIMIYQIMND